MRRHPLAAVLALGLTAASSTACSGGSSDSGKGEDGKIQVATSFYPLELAVRQIGGAHVDVTNLTKPGTEPHDLELAPKDVAKVSEAKLFVYEKGMAHSVDEAAANQAEDNAFDVSPSANLTLAPASPVAGHEDEEEGHDHGGKDPHFWLDPVRYRAVAAAIEKKLSAADPAHQADYAKNLRSFQQRLGSLDTRFKTGLKGCKNPDVVTSHAAFGYLAQRYGLKQVPIAGISPESEPSPAELTQIAAYAKKNKVRTIYTEELASPKLAQTVARTTGAQTATLDPVEGITSESAGKDYFGVMSSNLTNLQKGQPCR